MVSQVERGTSLFARGIGPLGVVALQFNSLKVSHEEDGEKLKKYLREYLPGKVEIALELSSYDQIVVFGESQVDMKLWEKLKTGGHYIFGGEGPLTFPESGRFEAKGKLWPKGHATEFGWRFDVPELGLENFEFAKIAKRS